MTLTPQQINVLKFVVQTVDAGGQAPTNLEIAHAIGVKQPTSARDKVDALVRLGLFGRGETVRRSIIITDAGRAWIAANPGL